MFAIEFWVGPKYGGWITGKLRFASIVAAEARDLEDTRLDRRAGGSWFMRRAVNVA